MRATRSSGSVEGVLSNGHPYSDSFVSPVFFERYTVVFGRYLCVTRCRHTLVHGVAWPRRSRSAATTRSGFSIDPAFENAGGYSLVFSAGVGNEANLLIGEVPTRHAGAHGAGAGYGSSAEKAP